MTAPIADVARMCSYVTDDGAVAAYFKISRDKVAEARKHIPRSRQIHSGIEHYTQPQESVGLNRDAADKAGSKHGSAALLKALEKTFDTFARKHGVTYLDARTLLMDTGVNRPC